ncbi:Frizzled-6, partial [Takifugu flavidus]
MLMPGPLWTCLALMWLGSSSAHSLFTCEPIKVHRCLGMSYNMTFFPNMMDHFDQDIAATHMKVTQATPCTDPMLASNYAMCVPFPDIPKGTSLGQQMESSEENSVVLKRVDMENQRSEKKVHSLEAELKDLAIKYKNCQ